MNAVKKNSVFYFNLFFQVNMPLSSLGLTAPQGYNVTEAFTGKQIGVLKPVDSLNVTVNPSGVYMGIADYIP